MPSVRKGGGMRPAGRSNRRRIAMRSLLGEFKTFVLRGNVVDLAVGIVIGAAFGAVVQGMVRDLFTPLIAAIFGTPDFSALTFRLNQSVFRYGDFLNLVIALLTIALAVFFFFFFSSRRRHTSSLRDWSSDVCSSDLAMWTAITARPYRLVTST